MVFIKAIYLHTSLVISPASASAPTSSTMWNLVTQLSWVLQRCKRSTLVQNGIQNGQEWVWIANNIYFCNKILTFLHNLNTVLLVSCFSSRPKFLFPFLISNTKRKGQGALERLCFTILQILQHRLHKLVLVLNSPKEIFFLLFLNNF